MKTLTLSIYDLISMQFLCSTNTTGGCQAPCYKKVHYNLRYDFDEWMGATT